MSFTIDKRSPIVLYGNSSFRPNIFSDMKNSGYNIVAYFDVRADELNGRLDVPVYTIENAPFTENEKKEICVLLCLQNAVQHNRVAKILAKHGYEKILFLPTNQNIRPEYAKILRKQFNYFYRDEYDKIGEIPVYNDIFYKELDYSRCILNKQGDIHVVLLPLDIVYSGLDSNNDFNNINLSAYLPYIKLFNFFAGNYSSCEEYIDFIKSLNVNSVNDTIIFNRCKLNELFIRELNRGMDFFIESAPPAAWNEKGYFNLEDGQHRTTFLITKGLTLFPCRIKKSHFEKWINNKKLTELTIFILDNDITQLPSPIAHPAFIFFNDISCGSIYKIFKLICGYFETSQIKGKSVLEIGKYNGFFARFFARTTTEPVFIVQNDKVLNQLAKLANELLYLDNIHVIKNDKFYTSGTGHVDILIMMRFVPTMMTLEEEIDFFNKVDIFVLEFIVWESGENPEDEKEFIINHSSFKKYIFLSKHFNGEYISEVGIFKRK